MVVYCYNYENPLCDVVRLQNKVVRIINDVPIHDHITPHYINLQLLKFPDIVKQHTCLFLYDHFNDKKSSKFSFSFISEQHNYATPSAGLYRTVTDSFIPN